MEENLDYIGLKTHLEQSEIFKRYYENAFDLKPKSQILSRFTAYRDIPELLNQILAVSENLTDFQKTILENFFIAFDDIRAKIDPNRLKSFKYDFNSDEELVLHRNTEKGLTNIIINPDECFAFSFIPKNHEIPKSLTFHDENYEDFEGLAYRFFS